MSMTRIFTFSYDSLFPKECNFILQTSNLPSIDILNLKNSKNFVPERPNPSIQIQVSKALRRRAFEPNYLSFIGKVRI